MGYKVRQQQYKVWCTTQFKESTREMVSASGKRKIPATGIGNPRRRFVVLRITQKGIVY